MLQYVGSIDSELRDELIYPQFSYWIRKKQLNSQQFREVFLKSLNQMMFGLGDTNNDSVFIRSFSNLLLAECVTHDQGLTTLEFDLLLNQTHQYVYDERDIRGYVKTKGWAHSIAHWADLVTAIVSHRHYEKEQIENTLSAVVHALIKKSAYTDDETDRLASAIYALLNRFGDHELIIGTWLETFPTILSKLKSNSNQNLLFYRTRTNMFHFLSAFYFDSVGRKEEALLHEKSQTIISHIRNRS